ncbi:MAG TPA: hypothetical protein VGM92_13900, partial [Candidatus Kapabacteria bacterium]
MFSLLFCALVLVLLSSSVEAQSILHYTFKPEERLKYHYKVSRSLDAMGKRGLDESVTDFEADPEWLINDVSMNGEATAVLTNRERKETYLSGHARMNSLHFTPQSELSIDRNGKLMFAHILIDDT